jgi:hypothetical protein
MAKRTDRKFRELLLYLARKTEGDPRCSRTKIYKILFYADFLAFQKLGHSISEQNYQRLPNGPAPKRALPILERMQSEGLCVWAERDFYGRTQQKLVALREPDLSLFTGDEIAIVDEVIAKLWPYTASDVSELSHRFIGWQLARDGEDIPYSTVALGEPRPPTPREIEYGQRLAREMSG